MNLHRDLPTLSTLRDAAAGIAKQTSEWSNRPGFRTGRGFTLAADFTVQGTPATDVLAQVRNRPEQALEEAKALLLAATGERDRAARHLDTHGRGMASWFRTFCGSALWRATDACGILELLIAEASAASAQEGGAP